MITRKIVNTNMLPEIVGEYATLVAMVRGQENVHFTFKCSFVSELKINRSISHNGVCLTVVSMTDDTYTVTAMKETLDRSNLGLLEMGSEMNVGRSMMMNGRLDGHIIQGHVGQTATCIGIEDTEGSYYFTFQYEFDKKMTKRDYITVGKGSVAVSGISLTVCNPTDDTFQVVIVPYAFEYTNFHVFEKGSMVNLEFDIIDKYINRMIQYEWVMDDFLQLMASRQSNRAYDMSRAIEHDRLERILEAARLSPSVCNAQPWHLVMVTDPELAVRVGKATAELGMNKFAKGVPIHILAVEESVDITSFLGAKIEDKYFSLIGTGITAAHITPATEGEGLGSCILRWFDEKGIKKLVGIPANKQLLLSITIGYPVREKRKRSREFQGKIISCNHY